MRRLAIVLAAGLAGAVPATAGASVAAVAGPEVTVVAGSGETNEITIGDRISGTVLITDAAGISAGAGCAPAGVDQAICSLDGVSTVRIETGDLDDSMTTHILLAMVLDTGPGNDFVWIEGSIDPFAESSQCCPGARAALGPGDDQMIGFYRDRIDGGPGNDVIHASTGASVMNGGDGVDRVTYEKFRNIPIVANLDGAPGDGMKSAPDATIGADVEQLTGGADADRLTGNGSANRLDGGGGDDTLTGGDGVDELLGGPGNDTLDAADAAADRLDCGADLDSVTADPVDVLAESCETRAIVTPAPAPQTSPAVAPARECLARRQVTARRARVRRLQRLVARAHGARRARLVRQLRTQRRRLRSAQQNVRRTC